MSSQKPSKRGRRVCVEQNLHATAAGDSKELLAKARTSCTSSRLTDGNHSKNSSTVEVLKQRRHRHSRAAETPGSAEFPRAPVDSRAEGPVHTVSLSRT